MKKLRFAPWISVLAAFAAMASAPASAPAQARNPDAVVAPSLFDGLRFRPLPFARGGRSTAVAGVAGDKLTYYFGSTGGGVWKTTDAGLTWTNVSDGFFQAGSIGAVTVAPSDPNVVYVGTGSACPRGNISPGVGLYRSVDAGATWSFSGLPDSGQVGRIAVHPLNPDLVYVAALGRIFGPNPERGVFRSKDGGRTWDKVLFVSDKTGAVDIAFDPTNPRILFAALWTVRRSPWTIDSGSEES
ncbi:MAG: glycosyl hydrolase, partial [Candidatus Aminicenantes bacterium]|nr:glycosyl hydrolase [Candidatus Aminicenantes bacterium]